MSVTNPYHLSVLRDRSWGFNWATRNTDLIRSLNAPCNSVALNHLLTETLFAAEKGRCLSYSRNKGHYDGKQRYYGRAYTYRNVIQCVDVALHHGLVTEDRTKPGHRGWQSRLEATDKLRELMAGEARIYDPHEILRMKNEENTDWVDYRETDATRRMRRQLLPINDLMRNVSIDFSDAANVARTEWHFVFDDTYVRRSSPELYRSFSRGSFDCNGRAYGPWQNTPKDQRRFMLLNGEPTTETDFSRMHPTMLYDRAGIRMIGDAYEVDGFDKADVKVCLLVCLNAENRQSAIGALMEKLDLDREETGRLIDATKQRHAAIADYLHSDVGIRLMKQDSEIMLGVMERCTKAGIPALPVHDSVIAPKKHEGQIAEFMLESYARQIHGLNQCNISVSA